MNLGIFSLVGGKVPPAQNGGSVLPPPPPLDAAGSTLVSLLLSHELHSFVKLSAKAPLGSSVGHRAQTTWSLVALTQPVFLASKSLPGCSRRTKNDRMVSRWSHRRAASRYVGTSQ